MRTMATMQLQFRHDRTDKASQNDLEVRRPALESPELAGAMAPHRDNRERSVIRFGRNLKDLQCDLWYYAHQG